MIITGRIYKHWLDSSVNTVTGPGVAKLYSRLAGLGVAGVFMGRKEVNPIFFKLI
jgi:hypothetical protein